MKSATLFLVSILSIVVNLASCKGENSKELIVNKWTLKEWVPGPGIQLPDSIKAKVLNTATIEFTSDNKYTLTGMGEVQNGTYQFSADGKLLTLISPGSQNTFVDTVKVLTKNKLIIHDQMGNQLTCSNEFPLL